MTPGSHTLDAIGGFHPQGWWVRGRYDHHTSEPSPDPRVVPSGDPSGVPTPDPMPGEDGATPDVQPASDPF